MIEKQFEALRSTCQTGQIERLEMIGKDCTDVIIDLGGVEGCVPPEEQLPGETYRVGSQQ